MTEWRHRRACDRISSASAQVRRVERCTDSPSAFLSSPADRTALATETTRYQPLLKSGDRHFVKVNYEHVVPVHYAAAEDKKAVELTKMYFHWVVLKAEKHGGCLRMSFNMEAKNGHFRFTVSVQPFKRKWTVFTKMFSDFTRIRILMRYLCSR